MNRQKPGKIQQRDRDAILQSLYAGVVPRRGLHHIQVGRQDEVTALLNDIDTISDGGASVRFVIGEYGSGKTFLLHVIRSAALHKQCVTINADIGPERRFYGQDGKSRKLYAELTRTMATRSKPDGNAMTNVVERFVSAARQEAADTDVSVKEIIHSRLEQLSELVGGYDFAEVIGTYWQAYEQGDDDTKAAAIRWLRGEFTVKTDARKALGVRNIVDDSNIYEHIKLLSKFVSLAGYNGLLVVVDELVSLYKLPQTQARNRNYERILEIINDCLQGSVEHLGFIMAGTPEFLTDRRRGLYSFEALESRLAENQFASDDFRDLSGPVIRIENLSREELYLLLEKLVHVQAKGNPERYLLDSNGIAAFMDYCHRQLGSAYFQTPRSTIMDFVQLLRILEQNPDSDWRDHLEQVHISKEAESEREVHSPLRSSNNETRDDVDKDNGLASFEL